MQLTYFTTERIRPFTGTKSSTPRLIKATGIIVAYRSGSRIEQSCPHQISISFRYKSNQLQQSTFLWAQDTDIFQSDQFCQTEIHTSCCIIKIGMGSIDHQIILTGFHHTPLDIGRTGQGFECFKGQRMMRNNQVTPHLYRLVHYIFGDVETKKHTGSKLIHITDLSWGRVNHPEEIVQLDQKLKVVILDFDDQKKRIALGLKQLTPHPWEALDQNLKVGDKVKGRVVVMADYGAFVEIAPGVEGLIHVSEMSWSQHLRSAQEFMKVGDEVEAVILTLDRSERKMSLGIKQLTPDPWENIEIKYPVGTKCNAKVRNFTNFGVFVEIEEGIDGLIHISDLSWTKKVKHPGEFTSVGADIEVVVLEIDKENRRLSLGHKQLEENPWNEFEGQFSIDSIHEGTVTELVDKGAIVSLTDSIEGFCPMKHLVKEDGTTAKVGEKLPFKVLEFSKATKRITLSHLRTYEEAKRAEVAAEKAEKRAAADATKSTVKKINASVEKTTLGDIAGLAALKSAMEAAEAKSAKKAAAKKEDEE